MHFGERLKEERKRLDLTQQALADACGVSKRQQLYYEADQWPGGAYLAAAAALGIDVNYVLTGKRAGQMNNPQDALLLAAFRTASPEIKRVVMAALGAADKAPTAGANTVFQNANIGEQYSGNVEKRGKTVINVGGRAKKK